VMMAVQFLVVLLWYPETKGISLEEMQKKLGIA
jgi:MFS transporter, SP family, arabinose:H+ symporter